MDKYRHVTETICTPQGLNERVISAAREVQPEKRQKSGILRATVCAACALALVAGTFSMRWDDTPVLSYEFGIIANALDRAANGGLVIRWEDGCGSFQITGSDINSIVLRTDRGLLLRNGVAIAGEIAEEYLPDTTYGIMPVGGDMEQLDGAALTLTVTFADNTAETKTYRLTAENLRMFRNADGGEVLVPALTGDSAATVPALYATGTDSRWLVWPVTGSNTVSLSQPYGGRVPPGGGEPVFHAGIDIPGEHGMEIAAAADGTVVDTGFDSVLGYWLQVDHEDGLTTYYGCCQETLAEEGSTVKAGEIIALMGSTGMSTGPHLHFEVKENGINQNPVSYFDKAVRDALQAK